MKPPLIDILIPTYNRPTALAVTLTSLYFQENKSFRIIVSDQGDTAVKEIEEVQAIARTFSLRGQEVLFFRNLPKRGMSQQRQFLLELASSQYVLYLDDDLILEPFMIDTLTKTIENERCGFVGTGTIGLNYLSDVRPEEEIIEFWEGRVEPEIVHPKSQKWKRHRLHNAANLYHLQKKLSLSNEVRKYKLAWASGCILYDRQKLLDSGGFDFGSSVPKEHCGEDVAAQMRVMANFGGCGVLPSGVYHQELKTTLPNRKFNIPERIDLFSSMGP
jgi:glycosyltransferase involved in cell wall biosynthesis